MHPIGCWVSGLLAAFLFALGGDVAKTIAEIQTLIGLLFAGMSVPDLWVRHKGAWIAGSLLGRQVLMVRGLEFAGLTDDEMTAIMAHELGHTTMLDRVWRTIGGMIGGCTIPVVAAGLIERGFGPDPKLFLALAAASALPALAQWWSLRLSERRADRFAIATLRDRETAGHLLTAKVKLLHRAQEQHGLYPEERRRPREKLHAEYLTELGGMDAVPRCLVPRRRFAETTPVGGGLAEWLTLEGRFVARLVNGRRTVADIVQRAQRRHGSLDEFTTIRLLHQLKQRKFIG